MRYAIKTGMATLKDSNCQGEASMSLKKGFNSVKPAEAAPALSARSSTFNTTKASFSVRPVRKVAAESNNTATDVLCFISITGYHPGRSENMD